MNDSLPPDVYRLLVEQMADAIVYTDTQGIVRAWNGAAAALFGFSRDEIIGQHLDLIIPEHLRAAHWAGFHRAMVCGATRHGRRAMLTRARGRAGEAIYVEMSFAVITAGDGQVIGAVAVARPAPPRLPAH